MNLEGSEVLGTDFPGIRNIWSLIDLRGLCNLRGLNGWITAMLCVKAKNIQIITLQFSNFLKKYDPDDLIITGTKLTNTGNFLWNGSPKIQFFTNIWHSVWRRLLRPCEVKKVSNDGSGINFHYSGSHWSSVFGRFLKTSGQARSLLCVKT